MMMTLETRLKALEAQRTTDDTFCHCGHPRKFDYRRAISALEPGGSGVSEPEYCPNCGKEYDDIRVFTYVADEYATIGSDTDDGAL